MTQPPDSSAATNAPADPARPHQRTDPRPGPPAGAHPAPVPEVAPSAPDGSARVLLVRHGETPWSLGGQHTGRTDIPLLDRGRRMAELLGERLQQAPFDGLPHTEVRSSPLVRAAETCELAGFGSRSRAWDSLMEWDYGQYEGLTTPQIRERAGEDWMIWRDGVVGGESLTEVTGRADEIVRWARSAERDVLVFAHGHILRTLAARWLGLELSFGARLRLSPASISVLGWAYGMPAIERWNDTGHLDGKL